jgi:hypothetical protein
MSKSETVVVGSKLPFALQLNHPLDVTVKVTVKGLNSAPKGINGVRMTVPYMTSEVPADFWKAWKFSHDVKGKTFQPLASGAIFECPSLVDAEKVYREREKEPTGLEPTKYNFNGVKPDNGKD